jgi:glucose-1-phosphate cytidylyltransferase
MKVAILAGGKGTRFFEETRHRPKPMIEVGGQPILLHIMMQCHACGFSDFNIALGYKGDVIRRWFSERETLRNDLRDHKLLRDFAGIPDWSVDLVDTGLDTNTGGRIKALGPHLGDETFILTWGDGVSDVDFNAAVDFHLSHGKLATMVVVRPPARFGHVEMSGDLITDFREKPARAEGWINGGMFVLEPEVLDYIAGPDTQFEKAPLETLARDQELMAYRHEGYWQCMDTLHDRIQLEDIWATGQAPWQTWRGQTCTFSSQAAVGT